MTQNFRNFKKHILKNRPILSLFGKRIWKGNTKAQNWTLTEFCYNLITILGAGVLCSVIRKLVNNVSSWNDLILIQFFCEFQVKSAIIYYLYSNNHVKLKSFVLRLTWNSKKKFCHSQNRNVCRCWPHCR